MGSREKMNEFIEKAASATGTAEMGAESASIQRIKNLLDEESFVEVNRFVQSRGHSYGFEREKIDGDGVVVGYGTIDGRLVYVASQEPTVYAGSMGQMHAKKISGIIQMAIQSSSPFVGIYDTGGARIEEGILALEGLSEVLSSLNEASGVIPTVAAVVGPCPGGSAFAAGLSSFCFMTEKGSGIYMNGPMVTSAAEGRTMEPAEIGGARVHAVKTGLASIVCKDVPDCMKSIRTLLSYLPECPGGIAVEDVTADDPNRTEVRLDEIAHSLDTGYNMHEILRLVLDRDSIFEFSTEYAPGFTTAFARLDGFTVGILANQAVRMDSESSKKAAAFVRTCDSFQIPVLSFIDCEGFSIGITAEHSDIISSGTDLYRAMDSCTVPRIAVLVGKAFGTAYLTLASKQSGCDFVYAWPTSEISVVSPDTAANIIHRRQIAASQNPVEARNEFVRQYSDKIASSHVAASLGHVDEVIMPSATRPRLASSLHILLS